MTTDKIENVKNYLNKVKGIEKVLVLSDLHIPFHKEELIIDIVKKHLDSSLIVFAGDILDCFSVSSFPKELQIPLYEELQITSNFLNKIDKLTPNIPKVMFRGNHEFRYKRYLAKESNEFSPFMSDDILKIISDGYSYRDYKGIKRTVDKLSANFTIVDNWYYIYRDVVFAHPTNFSKLPMRTCLSAYDYFKNQGVNFNAIMIGHTHKAGNVIYSGTLLSEIGCLCNQMDYANNGNVNYTPQTNAYGLVVFNKEKVNIYQSGAKFVYTGSDVL